MNYDLIVIGGGPAGYEVAASQGAEGKSVLIVERDLLGGTCLNRGCIPTKCLCAAAETLDTVRNCGIFGIETGQITADYGKALERTDGVVAGLREGVESALSKCTLVRGTAAVLPDGGIDVDGAVYHGRRVIIATGSRPSTLPVPGAELAVDSDSFLKSPLPQSLVIIGGGVIGLEFAYIAAIYGTKVTVVEYCKEILPAFDSEVAKRLRLLLAARGIEFITSAKVTSIASGDRLTVSYEDKKGILQSIEAEKVLMAVGRRAVLPDGLAEAGIEVNDRGFIVTDDSMQTTRPGFYAAGDCNGRLMLAHAATAQAMRAVGHDVNLDVIPAAVFTSPELAVVGLTTEQCKAQGIDYVSRKALYRANGKALASGHEEGFVKVLYEPLTRRLLGCHILGAHASDLIQEATLAIAQGLTIDGMALNTVHGHPTLTEIVASALS